MSSKAIIKNLADSQLIKIVMDFIRNFNLSYEKVHKEISYKCYEGTWIVNRMKATGYGRTQTQAYKSALKNLLELLMEDSQHHHYFSQLIQNKKGYAISNNISTPLKTELKSEIDTQYSMKMHDGLYTKINYLTKEKQQSHSSKINWSTKINQNIDKQIEHAKTKMKNLQTQLNRVLDQNKMLRERLNQSNAKYKTIDSSNNKISRQNINSNKTADYPSQNGNRAYKRDTQAASKVAVPKLNLQVLPNYHKKSQKCLNNMLLAAYNQNRKNLV